MGAALLTVPGSRVEATAAARPGVPSAFPVLVLAGFGYAVLAGTLVIIGVACLLLVQLLLSGHLAWGVLKIGLLLVPVGWFILRSLWFRIQPPSGLVLQRPDAPRLFALVDRVREALRAPRIDTVLLTEDLNAGVAHVPWLGVLGPGRNYLVLGLPLERLLAGLPLAGTAILVDLLTQKALARRVRRVSGSCVYRRRRRSV